MSSIPIWITISELMLVQVAQELALSIVKAILSAWPRKILAFGSLSRDIMYELNSLNETMITVHCNIQDPSEPMKLTRIFRNNQQMISGVVFAPRFSVY